MERSHRSYHDQKPFANFEHRAKVKNVKKKNAATLGERLKALFHRTTNK